jgi:NitT/TauT family transport system permease protein
VTDLSVQQNLTTTTPAFNWRRVLPGVLALLSVVIMGALVARFLAYMPESDIYRDSTLAELVVWVVDQAAGEAPASLLAQIAQQSASPAGPDLSVWLEQARWLLVIWAVLVAGLTLLGLVGAFLGIKGSRAALIAALVLNMLLLFNFPVLAGDNTVTLILLSGVALIGVLVFLPGPVTKVLGFVVILSLLLLAWHVSKALAAALSYQITVPAANWTYNTYPSLDEALAALQAGDLDVVIADRRDVRDIIAPLPPEAEIDPAALPYPDLRYLNRFDPQERVLGILPIAPEFPGRLSVVIAGDRDVNGVADLLGQRVGTIAGEFADERYLSADRRLVLLDLKILNDINLPPLQSIAEALLQPARRNGPLLLVRILTAAALHTWGEALGGFAMGATLGFLLGTAFAHFAPLERGMLPYVVASQTVPILAIAPMVVIWLGAGPLAVAVISAYLTFFPVTINTLRGLRAPHPTALELMESYAASRWDIMWKLRFPAALPYIFTALKVSATASVVGAIIGELPSSIRDGLGRAILDFSSDYSLVTTPKLWAAILIAASVGILSFLIVSLVERLVLRGYVRGA